MLTDALKQDLRTADDIACNLGQRLTEPVRNEDDYLRRCVYALSVAVIHILTYLERKEAKE